MDFTKYVSMLDSGGLYFSRADLLGDAFEGTSSQGNIKLRPQVYKELLESLDLERLDKADPPNQDSYMQEAVQWAEQPRQMRAVTMKYYRQWFYVNSWHMNEHESAAMWRLYAKTEEAIAIQTTYARLRDCLPSEVDVRGYGPVNIYIGEVQYIDYDTDWMPEWNLLQPIVHKRKSFEHERELRAVIFDSSSASRPGDTTYSRKNQSVGLPVEVSLNDLIEAVYVAPTAPSWFRDLVAAITGKFGLAHKPVIRSSLGQDPVY